MVGLKLESRFGICAVACTFSDRPKPVNSFRSHTITSPKRWIQAERTSHLVARHHKRRVSPFISLSLSFLHFTSPFGFGLNELFSMSFAVHRSADTGSRRSSSNVYIDSLYGGPGYSDQYHDDPYAAAVPEVDDLLYTTDPRVNRRRRKVLMLASLVAVAAILFTSFSHRVGKNKNSHESSNSNNINMGARLACPNYPQNYFQDVVGSFESQSMDWCRSSNQEACICKNPVLPNNVQPDTPQRITWQNGFSRNLKTIQALQGNSPDIVFFGGSVAEHWRSSRRGYDQSEWYRPHDSSPTVRVDREVFQKYFSNGLVLGMTYDTTEEMLYRLDNGELPDWLNPKVFWIHLEGESLFAKDCSVEATAAGYVAIVERIRSHSKNARIVINSLLPDENENEGARDMRTQLNYQMACFAEGIEDGQVTYFDSTSLFVDNKGRPNQESIWTVAGSEILAQSIRTYLRRILPNESWRI